MSTCWIILFIWHNSSAQCSAVNPAPWSKLNSRWLDHGISSDISTIINLIASIWLGKYWNIRYWMIGQYLWYNHMFMLGSIWIPNNYYSSRIYWRLKNLAYLYKWIAWHWDCLLYHRTPCNPDLKLRDECFIIFYWYKWTFDYISWMPLTLTSQGCICFIFWFLRTD